MWREEEGAVEWRASLHNPQTGERLGFRSVRDLFAYLQQQTGLASSTENNPNGAE